MIKSRGIFPSVEEPQGGYHWLCACPRCRGIWVTQYYDILLPFPPCGPVFENFNLLPHYSVIRNIIEVLLTVQNKSKGEALSLGRMTLGVVAE